MNFWLEPLSRNRIQYLWIICKMAYRNLYAPLRYMGMLLIVVSDNNRSKSYSPEVKKQISD